MDDLFLLKSWDDRRQKSLGMWQSGHSIKGDTIDSPFLKTSSTSFLTGTIDGSVKDGWLYGQKGSGLPSKARKGHVTGFKSRQKIHRGIKKKGKGLDGERFKRNKRRRGLKTK